MVKTDMDKIFKVLVVIPARGGSQRIKNKNIQKIDGKAMISWPIKELKKIKFINEIIVSTDSEKIKNLSLKAGASVPFMRPKKLSDNFTGISPVIKHAAEWYLENISELDFVITVYPTAIFLTHQDIENAFNIIKNDSGIDCIFAATDFAYPIQRAIYTDKNDNVHMFNPKYYNSRSQDLTPALHDAGQFYIHRIKKVLDQSDNFQQTSRIFYIPRKRVIDIDTIEDLKIAKLMFKMKKDIL